MTDQKLPAMQPGRQSKYSPAYCQIIFDAMAQGYTLSAAAGAMGVCRATVYNWMAAHADFRQAVKTGESARQHYWESQLMRGGAMTGSAIFALKQYPDDWRDKVEVTSTTTPTIDADSIDVRQVARAVMAVLRKAGESAAPIIDVSPSDSSHED